MEKERSILVFQYPCLELLATFLPGLWLSTGAAEIPGI